MNVILISESQGKATQTVRRILDRYANRIGQNTWEAALSEEGLATVHSLLRQRCSRLMRVACHRITHYGRRKLLWTIGSKEPFSPEGHFATGWTQRNLPPGDDTAPPQQRLLTRIVSLAALCHDLGKATYPFQRMIRGGDNEALRHEWLSVEILALIVCDAGNEHQRWQFPTDGVGIARLKEFADRSDPHQWLTDNLHEVGKTFGKKGKDILNRSVLSQPVFDTSPVLATLFWLVMSHHKMPDGIDSMSRPESHGSNYAKKDEQFRECFTFKHEGCPWQDTAWLTRFNDDLNALAAQLEMAPPSPALPDWARLYGRLAFQIADHGVSSWTRPAPEAQDHLCYANPADSGHALGQRLPRHLLDVSRHSVRAMTMLARLRATLPGIDTDALPPNFRRASPARFAWQDKAVNKLKTRRKEIQGGALFGVLIAETGSGKTVAAPRLLAALSDSLRLTYTSPTRMLTLQAGDRLRDVGFQVDQFASIIGDSMVQQLYRLENPNEGSGEEYEPDSDDETPLLAGGSDAPDDFAERFPLLSGLKPRDRKLLCTPVLSATLDTLMKMADGRRGNHVEQGMRLLSSDLIIDEVDHYSPEDLIALGRLLENAGFWRVNVILSSATLPPSVAVGLFRAWATGMVHRDYLDGKTAPLFAGWLSNLQEAEIHRIGDDARFDQLHHRYIEQLAQIIQAAPIKRSIDQQHGFFKTTTKQIKGNDPKQWLAAIDDLHREHGFSDPLTGRKVSVGCIQVVNVRECQTITQMLVRHAEQPNITLKVVCLHARMTLAVRNTLEARLNRMLARHNGDAAIFIDPDVREAVSQAKTDDVAIVVVSTMESTGRDHDFDWGILETRQFSTLIQFAGRIRRHRPPNGKSANIIVCNLPLRYWWLDEKSRQAGIEAYQFFGVNDEPIRLSRGTAATVPRLKVEGTAVFSDLLPKALTVSDDKLIVNSASSLLESQGRSNCIRDVEHDRFALALLHVGDGNKALGLNGWLRASPCFRLLDEHPSNYRFRRNSSDEFVFWRDHDGQWQAKKARGKREQGRPQVICAAPSELSLPPDGWLFPISEPELLDEMAQKLALSARDACFRLGSIRIWKRPEGSGQWGYHPQVGLVFPVSGT